ncbi:MAG: FAD-binding and (Fe-S)-binding domain-containing protein [Phycisphaerales bacterium]
MKPLPLQQWSPADATLSAHAEALSKLLDGEVRFGRHDRMLYATDASIYQVEPLGVVIPANIDDVEQLVRYASEHGLPVLPRGGGTSLAGQCVSRAIVVDVSAHCRAIESVDAANRRCRVEAGITVDDLNDRLRPEGVFFAPDPATARQANIGGVIGNNAAGTRSIRYGRTSENLEGVRVVLADGRPLEFGPERNSPEVASIAREVVEITRQHASLIRERFARTIRRNAGYALDAMLDQIESAEARGHDPIETLNLAPLICGSEGTLAVTTHATLKLHPTPKATGLATLGFESLDDAMETVTGLLELRPSAVELLDDLILGLARENNEYAEYVKLMPQPQSGKLRAVLYVEFFSDESDEEIEVRFEALRRFVDEQKTPIAMRLYQEQRAILQALKLRKAGEPLLHAIPGRRKPVGFVEDNAVPVERLSEFVREFRRIVESEGTIASFYAHASVGVLHVRPLLDLRSDDDRDRMERIAVEVADLARSLGGVMSGEHGDGRSRGPLLERFFGAELMQAFRAVKRIFDPENRLNPGNIVQPGPLASIHESIRVRPDAMVDLPMDRDHDTHFRYDHEQGFDHAVELCNGAGVCRKKVGGSMCPSYMATLDERHSTRGRGNALRLAISGQFNDDGRPAWNDPGTLETLDLCLSCKACKTECPSNVDIARYKSEYLAQSYRANDRIPLAARFFGSVHRLNRLGSSIAPVSNWLSAAAPSRALLNRLLNLAPERPLPRFERSLFRQRKRTHEPATTDRPTVILYADCFTAYNEPRIGLAAVRVFEGLGYRVLTPRVACCGRALISTGMLSQARRVADQAARELHDLVESESPSAIVCCEPSCLASVKDDWLELRLETDRSDLERLAVMSFLPEEFVERGWEDHPVRPNLRRGGMGSVVLHGHCHQKALWGIETSAAPLRRFFGDEIEALDTGCCGMAGSFGYAAHRYDLSMQIAELSLFPQLRRRGPTAKIAASGTSCRAQIQDGLGRIARHPIELIAEAMSSHT